MQGGTGIATKLGTTTACTSARRRRPSNGDQAGACYQVSVTAAVLGLTVAYEQSFIAPDREPRVARRPASPDATRGLGAPLDGRRTPPGTSSSVNPSTLLLLSFVPPRTATPWPTPRARSRRSGRAIRSATCPAVVRRPGTSPTSPPRSATSSRPARRRSTSRRPAGQFGGRSPTPRRASTWRGPA